MLTLAARPSDSDIGRAASASARLRIDPSAPLSAAGGESDGVIGHDARAHRGGAACASASSGGGSSDAASIVASGAATDEMMTCHA